MEIYPFIVDVPIIVDVPLLKSLLEGETNPNSTSLITRFHSKAHWQNQGGLHSRPKLFPG